jgi:hypothetical protein
MFIQHVALTQHILHAHLAGLRHRQPTVSDFSPRQLLLRSMGYEVLCHPDAYRDPTVVFLWTGTLWTSVLFGGAWVLWKRGEMSAQYANWMRLGGFTMVPFIGWVSFGVPVAQVSISTAFAFLTGLGKAGYDRGSW